MNTNIRYPFKLDYKSWQEAHEYIQSDTTHLYNRDYNVESNRQSLLQRDYPDGPIFTDKGDDHHSVDLLNAQLIVAVTSITEIWFIRAVGDSLASFVIHTKYPHLLASRLYLQDQFTINVDKNAVMFDLPNPDIALQWLTNTIEEIDKHNYVENHELVILDNAYHLRESLEDEILYSSNEVDLSTFLYMYRIDITAFSPEVFTYVDKNISPYVYVKGTHVYNIAAVLRAFMRGVKRLHVIFIKP